MKTVPGKLDEISEAIGGLRAEVSAVRAIIAENRGVQDTRHAENKRRLETIEQTLTGLASDRRLAVVIISTIVGIIIWIASHVAPFLFKKWWQ